MTKQKTITILGSTGSIGVQTLQVLEELKDTFRVSYLTANKNIDLLYEQTQKFKPLGIVIRDEKLYKEFKEKYSFNGKILVGSEGLIEASTDSVNDLVLSALVGFSGVEPTLAAIRAGTTIALANKETLVSAGALITKEARKYGVDIIAVDSEHSAILQCLVGESIDEVDKLILTASGGPFRTLSKEELNHITVKDALNHPNWSMGSKITIDSSTLMNKGFEVIEAYWLFGLGADMIDVVVHPQSIIHSMVEFIDGSVKAQLGMPDMRIPISYALSYPRRLHFDFPRLKLSDIKELTFFEPDLDKFSCLRMALESMKTAGTSATIINAANEIAVYSFLDEKIKYLDIARTIEETINHIEIVSEPDFDTILETDLRAREFATELINKKFSN